MKRFLTASTIGATLALAACGGGSGGGGSAATNSGAFSAKDLPGVGSVLVDSNGKALYTSDQEANGKILCTGACTSFWKPVPATGSKPAITRPDGSKQATSDGRPLYTFTEDSPAKATGDGFSDDFGGHHFTWHVVSASGKVKSSGTMSSKSSGGYGY